MIKISKLADYGTVIMDFLASDPQARYSATEVATGLRLATPTVSKVLKLLHEAALVQSERGTHGGYRLAKSPDAISVAAIISAIDGKPAMTECSQGDNVCSRDKICEVRHQWQFINQIIVGVLNNLSLSDMHRPLTEMKSLSCGTCHGSAFPRVEGGKNA